MYLLSDVEAVIHESGASPRSVRLNVRDLTEASGEFVSRGYIHPNASIEVSLPTLAIGQMLDASGTVTSCAHLRGVEHSISVMFGEAIDLAAVTAVIAEKGEKGTKGGVLSEIRVMLVDGSAISRTFLTNRLRGSKLMVEAVPHAGAAIDAIKCSGHLDAMLIDYELGDETGLEAMVRIRQEHYRGPMVVLTTELNPDLHRELREGGAHAVIVKPANPSLIASAVRESVLGKKVECAAQLLESSKFDCECASKLLSEISHLRDLLRAGTLAPAILESCRSLSGIAPSLGLTLLGRSAERAMLGLEAGLEMSDQCVKTLIEVLDDSFQAVRRT